MSVKDRDVLLYAMVVVATAIYIAYSNKSLEYSTGSSTLSFDELLASGGSHADIIHNAGNHLYPYMASVTAMSCLLAVIFIIICVGGNL